MIPPTNSSNFMKTLRHRRKPTDAFTLIEIMVVLIVIGILAAIIMPQFTTTTYDAKVSAAKASIATFGTAIQRFYIQTDRYPTMDEGLKILVEAPSGDTSKWRGPYVEKLQNDPWGNPYQYKIPGTHNPNGFDIWSRGADGADGGDGKNADVGNW